MCTVQHMLRMQWYTTGQLAKRQKVISSLRAALRKEQKQHADKQASLHAAEQCADAATRCGALPAI